MVRFLCDRLDGSFGRRCWRVRVVNRSTGRRRRRSWSDCGPVGRTTGLINTIPKTCCRDNHWPWLSANGNGQRAAVWPSGGAKTTIRICINVFGAMFNLTCFSRSTRGRGRLSGNRKWLTPVLVWLHTPAKYYPFIVGCIETTNFHGFLRFRPIE